MNVYFIKIIVAGFPTKLFQIISSMYQDTNYRMERSGSIGIVLEMRLQGLAPVCDVYCDFVTFPFGILGQV